MYENFFGFSGKPFDRNIATDSLYLTESHKELLSRLEYAASNRLFCVLTGDVGVGKTTAIRKFVNDLNKDVYQPVYISDSALTPRVFYWEVLKELSGMEKPASYRIEGKRKMMDVMSSMMEQGNQIPVIIIDEAHLLSRVMLEETRFLLNFKMDSHNPMSLIVAGQSELRTTLSKSIYEPICQRIDYRFKLMAFDRAQTADYIERHLKSVGVTENKIFSESAVNRIFEYSNGVARKINKACELSLIFAFQRHKFVIDEPAISHVIEQELSW
jgi:type II secretory pathway predicted ATPase ExeA